jgi:demethylmacrocin O-methyltransferase
LIHGLNYVEIDGDTFCPGAFDKHIVSMSFYHNMIFVEKGDNSEPSNVPPGDPLRRSAA